MPDRSKEANSRETVYQVEREKWNALATQDQIDFRTKVPDDDFYKYARRSSTMRGISQFLGDLRGKRVLEYGCGLGELSVLLAKSGAEVTAFDLSEMSVNVTRRRSVANDVADQVDLVVAPGEKLPFADESFDVVFGKAILHHLDVNAGWSHLYRVLKPNGKAAFTEPMGMNPLLNFARDYVPYPGKNPRGADQPLNYDEIHAWGSKFKEFQYHEFQLLAMLERGFGFNRRFKSLRRMDEFLLDHLPFLRRYCRYIVMLMVK